MHARATTSYRTRRPGTAKSVAQLTVDEPSIEAGRRILNQVADNYAHESTISNRKERRRARPQQSITPAITEEGLDTLDRLHRRYAGYSAYPGRPLRFIRGLLQERATAYSEQPPLGAKEVTESFAKETGLPLFLLDDSTSYNSQQTFAWFAERVIGQEKAVDLIVDLLATVKAGLTRPRHPRRTAGTVPKRFSRVGHTPGGCHASRVQSARSNPRRV